MLYVPGTDLSIYVYFQLSTYKVLLLAVISRLSSIQRKVLSRHTRKSTTRPEVHSKPENPQEGLSSSCLSQQKLSRQKPKPEPDIYHDSPSFLSSILFFFPHPLHSSTHPFLLLLIIVKTIRLDWNSELPGWISWVPHGSRNNFLLVQLLWQRTNVEESY